MKVRKGGGEEIPFVQGKEQQLRFAGAAVKRYPTPKVRETQVRWFQCVCPLMPSCNTYHLTWVSLTLGVGYLFTAVPAKRSQCSLPWTRGSSPPPSLTLNVE